MTTSKTIRGSPFHRVRCHHWSDHYSTRLSLAYGEEHPASIIQLNLAVLRRQMTSTQRYRIVETLFSNFNLFQQTNRTTQPTLNDTKMIGVPISYQIANKTMIHAEEDLVRFQIYMPGVRRTSFETSRCSLPLLSSRCNLRTSPASTGHSP